MEKRQDIINFLTAFDIKTGHLDSNKLIKQAVGFLSDTLNFKRTSIAILKPDQSGFIVKEATTNINDLEPGQFIPISSLHLGKVILNQTPIYHPDISKNKKISDIDYKLLAAGIQSDFSVPLIVEGKCIGTINCGSEKIDGISEYNRQILILVAPKLAQAISNAKLYEELQLSEQKFKGLLNSMDDLVFVLDSENRFVSYYSLDDKLLLKPGDFLGKQHSDIMPPYVDKVFNIALKSVKKGKTSDYEYSLEIPHGEQWYLAKLTPLFENDKYKGLIAVLRDITDRKQLEETRVTSEKKFRGLFNGMSAGVVFCKAIFDKDGKMIDCSYKDMNPAYEEFTNLKKETAIGRKVSEMLPGTEASWFASFDTVVQTGNPISFEMFHQHSNKFYSVFAYSPIKDEFSAIFLDITSQRKVEQSLKESKDRFKALSEASFEAIFISEKGVCLEQNSTAEKMFGFTSSEAVGRLGTEWILPEDRKTVMNNMITGNEEPYEVTALRKDGSTFPVEIQAKMMHYKGKDVRITALSDISLRKLAIDALKKSEYQYRKYFEMDISGIYLSTPKGKLLNCNPAFTKMLGYKREEILKINTSKLYPHPTNREEFIEQLQKNKQLINSEIDLVKADGQLINCVENVIGIFNDDGKLVQFQGYIIDVTEHKQAEEALKENEDKFKQLTNNSLAGIYIIAKQEIKYCNQQFANMWGYQNPDEIIGMNIQQLLPSKSLVKANDEMEERSSGSKEISHYEIKGLKKDGETFDIEILGSSIIFEGQRAAQGMIVDITQRKQAEELLLENLERQKLVLNSLPTVFYTTDTTKNLTNTWLSEQVENITGFKAQEMIADNKFWENRIHPDDKEETLKAYYSIFKSNYVETEYRWKIASGNYKWFLDKTILLRDEDKKPKQVMGLWIDITERKLIEKELRKHREHLEEIVKERTTELEEKNKELERFNQLFVGREFRIKELRDKVKELEKKSNN